jgi:hypothetical protein
LTWYQSIGSRERGSPLLRHKRLQIFCSGRGTMVSTLRVEDKLKGATNFRAWKARILLLLEENDLKDYVEMVIPNPKDAQELTIYKKREVKAKQVLLDYVKDHLIPHISEKKTTSENPSRKLILRHQL